MWKRGGFKYLGVYLGDEATVKKNWEGVIEKVERRLKKWRWLSPQMSFRGRCLIINNLVASLLWHRFTAPCWSVEALAVDSCGSFLGQTTLGGTKWVVLA